MHDMRLQGQTQVATEGPHAAMSHESVRDFLQYLRFAIEAEEGSNCPRKTDAQRAAGVRELRNDFAELSVPPLSQGQSSRRR